MRHFMLAGPRRGRLSAWQRKSGQRTLQRMPRQSTRVKWCSPSVHPTTVLHSISAEKAIWHPCPPYRLAFTTSPLSRAAGTTGTSTMLQRAVDRSLSAWQAGATIRNGGKAPLELHPGDVVNIPPGGQTLARCCTRLLVLSSGSGSAR